MEGPPRQVAGVATAMATATAAVTLAVTLIVLALAVGNSPLRASEPFVRGDVSMDGRIYSGDALELLEYLFASRNQKRFLDCLEAGDANDDGQINITDAVHLLMYAFARGPAPPLPYPECGPDPTSDALGCMVHPRCGIGSEFLDVPLDADGVFLVVSLLDDVGRDGLEGTKRRVKLLLSRFQPQVKFGLIFFHSRVSQFPASETPASAGDPKAIESAGKFLDTLQNSRGHCAEEALLAALTLARSSGGKRNFVFFMTSGGGTCGETNEASYLKETLVHVTKANQGLAVINTIESLPSGGLGADFLKKLAQMNGGTYKEVRS